MDRQLLVFNSRDEMLRIDSRCLVVLLQLSARTCDSRPSCLLLLLQPLCSMVSETLTLLSKFRLAVKDKM